MAELEETLRQLESELAEATEQQALLNAHILGLRAHRDALLQISDLTAASAASDRRPEEGRALTSMTKSEAIVAVLRQSHAPMSIREIVEALREAGRTSETYNGISVYLQTLLSQDRVRRPERGRYTAGESR